MNKYFYSSEKWVKTINLGYMPKEFSVKRCLTIKKGGID